jgi:hypothetical protein
VAQLSTLGIIHTLVKRFIVIAFGITFLAVSILLWRHVQHPTDTELGRQIIGTWTQGALYSMTIFPDGSYSESIGQSNAVVTYQGTWLVKNQALVRTITNEHGVGNHTTMSPEGSVVNNKIIHVDDHQFIGKPNAKPNGHSFTLTR